MMSTLKAILTILSDGQYHSGQLMAEQLGVSRAAVWKHIGGLEALGVALYSIPGKGYRLAEPLDLLSIEQVSKLLAANNWDSFSRAEFFLQLDSTNQRVRQWLDEKPGQLYLCVAEKQTAGRGRRGRQWLSPFAANLYLSMALPFEAGVAALEGFSLVVGLALVRALEAQGIAGVQLKWPNDLWVAGHKLAGILLEVQGDPNDVCDLIVGIGLNVAMSPQQGQSLDCPWTSLQQLGGVVPPRNQLLAALVEHCLAIYREFRVLGFAPFKDAWSALDALANQHVEVVAGDQRILGVARGVNDQGALLLETSAGLRTFNGGEVSLRPMSSPNPKIGS